MQKRMLKEWFEDNYTGGYKFDMAEKMDPETYEAIAAIHPTEIHYQNVNNYLEELAETYDQAASQKHP